MTTEVLRKKTGRYLCGESVPAEKKQIQNWLSCTGEKDNSISPEERAMIENEIVGQVQAYVASSLFIPKAEPWWKKITAFF
ncbi:MAG: hypothetical protein H7Y42_17695 [Chitinophagaceae bacterium]|nr:hypothetical protein [Chitinophagaceae bacterium]